MNLKYFNLGMWIMLLVILGIIAITVGGWAFNTIYLLALIITIVEVVTHFKNVDKGDNK